MGDCLLRERPIVAKEQEISKAEQKIGSASETIFGGDEEVKRINNANIGENRTSET